MYYRFVCSTEDIIECITDNTIIINTFDRDEQDDVIFCIKEKKKVLCWLNKYQGQINIKKKSISGIKLILNEETITISL